MENLQVNIKEWENKALDLSQRLAQFIVNLARHVHALLFSHLLAPFGKLSQLGP